MIRNRRNGISHALGFSVLAVTTPLLGLAGCEGNPATNGPAPDERQGVLVAAGTAAGTAAAPATGGDEAARIQRYLDSRYLRSDVLHAYRASSGQDIDCVDFMAQPGLKNPALAGHTPLTKLPAYLPPPPMPQGVAVRPEDDGSDEQGRARRCPDGSVPVIALTADSIRRRGGLDQFLQRVGTKGPPPLRPSSTTTDPRAPIGRPAQGAATGLGLPLAPQLGAAGYDWSTGSVYFGTLGCPAPGGGSILSINWPHVRAWNLIQESSDHSISQIWLSSPGDAQGCVAPNCKQTVEAGWNVDPQLYEDNYPHFFTFSTRDGYKTTGCYDMEPSCTDSTGTRSGSGLVLIQNPANIPGWALLNPSVTELSVYWYHSPDHNWWVAANGWVGYIPGSLFNNGNGGGAPFGGPDPTANYYPWLFITGGEVADSNALFNSGANTPTDMGNGQYAGVGSAYQHNSICTLNCDPDSDFFDIPAPLALQATDPGRYTIDASPPAGGANWGTYFYFGGPGVSPATPTAPTGLGAAVFDSEIVLTWTGVTDANTYDVHMSTTPGPPTSWQFGQISENRWDIDSLQNGTTYYFNVRAINDAGTSAWSNQISAVPTPLPSTPTGLATHPGTRQVNLTWNAAPWATSYTVRYATSSGGSLGNAHSGITGTSYTYTGLTTNKTYYFVVSAQNARGGSAETARVSGTAH